MQKNDIFSFLSYKAYLLSYAKGLKSGGRGFRTQLSEACGCRLSYISEVLNRNGNFSLEQAEAINNLLNHTIDESDYFLALVNHERAGSAALRTRLRAQIEKQREKRLVLKDRVDVKSELSLEDQQMYYGSWHFAAIHILVSLEHLRTREALCKYLQLSNDRVSEVLDFLVQVGLLIYEKGQYRVGQGRIFLGSHSPNIIRHHTHWRLRAIESMDRGIKNDFHYSSVVSLRNEDVIVVKETLAKAVDECRRIIRESPKDETVQVLTLDFFKL